MCYHHDNTRYNHTTYVIKMIQNASIRLQTFDSHVAHDTIMVTHNKQRLFFTCYNHGYTHFTRIDIDTISVTIMVTRIFSKKATYFVTMVTHRLRSSLQTCHSLNCTHLHPHTHIVQPQSPTYTHCTTTVTHIHSLYNHSHPYIHIVQSQSPTYTHCTTTVSHIVDGYIYIIITTHRLK